MTQKKTLSERKKNGRPETKQKTSPVWGQDPRVTCSCMPRLCHIETHFSQPRYFRAISRREKARHVPGYCCRRGKSPTDEHSKLRHTKTWRANQKNRTNRKFRERASHKLVDRTVQGWAPTCEDLTDDREGRPKRSKRRDKCWGEYHNNGYCCIVDPRERSKLE